MTAEELKGMKSNDLIALKFAIQTELTYRDYAVRKKPEASTNFAKFTYQFTCAEYLRFISGLPGHSFVVAPKRTWRYLSAPKRLAVVDELRDQLLNLPGDTLVTDRAFPFRGAKRSYLSWICLNKSNQPEKEDEIDGYFGGYYNDTRTPCVRIRD